MLHSTSLLRPHSRPASRHGRQNLELPLVLLPPSHYSLPLGLSSGKNSEKIDTLAKNMFKVHRPIPFSMYHMLLFVPFFDFRTQSTAECIDRRSFTNISSFAFSSLGLYKILFCNLKLTPGCVNYFILYNGFWYLMSVTSSWGCLSFFTFRTGPIEFRAFCVHGRLAGCGSRRAFVRVIRPIL